MLLIIQNEAVGDHPRRAFVSYSHLDKEWKDKIVNALEPLKAKERLSTWDDRELIPGQPWDGVIREELKEADLILFLVSPNFLESNYCREVEVQAAVERSTEGQAIVVPIILRKCDFDKLPFAQFQAYPVGGPPLEESEDMDSRMEDLREKLELALLGWWYPRRPRLNGGMSAVWKLQFRRPNPSDSPSDRELVSRLRTLAGEPDIFSHGRAEEQSTSRGTRPVDPILLLEGPTAAFMNLEKMVRSESLSSELGVEVVHFQVVLGATMKVASEPTEAAEAPVDETESLLLKESPHECPDLPLMLIVRDEQPGWMLLLPARRDSATPRNQFEEVQGRFTRYLGTILAVPEGRLTVNLSTYEPEHLLGDALDETELGHDLLEQDCLLKQFAGSLLHPDHPIGKAYWERFAARATEITGSDRVPLQAYQKVWIVAGEANVHEKTPEHPFGFEMPERFGVRATDRAASVTSCTLKLMCEVDYQAMEHYEPSNSTSDSETEASKIGNLSVSLFKELVLPAIEIEVNEGLHFAKLRQIFHAFVPATWYRRHLQETPSPSPLFDAIDQGVPEAFGVPRDEAWTEKNAEVYRRYVKLFEDGIFRCVRSSENGRTPRLYFSGGVRF